jgi:uncharacterized protein (TIGR02186 family)
MKPWRSALAVIAALLFTASTATAAELVSGLSTDLIQITSNFTGADIVLFGALEPSEELGQEADQDLVIVIRGPPLDMTVRRKARILGVWINREQVRFSGLAGYYFLASTRPLDDIASPATLERFRLGTANLEYVSPPGIDPEEADPFRAAAIRDRKRERLYWESPTGIEFLSRTLFRARIPVPASVPPGQYRAEVYLFQDGQVVSAQSSPLFIDKSGFERRVYDFAYQRSLAYGLSAVLMSVVLGWLASVAFRPRT